MSAPSDPWKVLLLALVAMVPVVAADQIDIAADLAAVLDSRHPRGVEELRLIEAHVRKIAQRAVPATVGVEVDHSVGSGVIISAEGLVLTAGHVIGQANHEATIVLPDGRRLPGHTLGANFAIDAGMVQITNPPADLPFVPIADALKPASGQWVLATGQPGGVFLDRAPPLRLGRILATEEGWVCTDCTLVGGDSGGPLLNMHGQVTAIHTSIGPEIIHNFHVPVARIQEDWQRLLAGEVWGGGSQEPEAGTSRPLLGVAGRTENERCLITQVFPSLPAQEAGVLVGDLILSVDGEEVSSFAEVAQLVFAKRPGQTIRMKLQRKGENIELDVVLSAIRVPFPGGALPETE